MWYQQNRFSKAKKQEYNGFWYDSGFEAQYAMELDLRLKAGEITGYDRQVKLPLECNGYHIANYYMDFVVYYPDGGVEYVETKGIASEAWKLKWKILEAMLGENSNIKLTLVMQKKFRMRKIKKL